MENTDMAQIDKILDLGASVIMNSMESYNPILAQTNSLEDTINGWSWA